MAYSEFTFESVIPTFQLEKIDTAGLFADAETVVPSANLTMLLERKTSLATLSAQRKLGLN